MSSTVTPASEAPLELTIVMPCLNEAETLATCIDKANAALHDNGIAGEVVVADNGSTDGSQQIAVAHGARVVPVPIRGYGAALNAGILAARGKYVLMADADDSYEFAHAPRFLAELRNGAEIVMGNRFRGGIGPGAMPPLHRYLGNPVLSFLGRWLFRTPIGDFHCGIRAFSVDAYKRLDLRTTGMEFASEMVVKSALLGQRMTEVPTTLKKDGRSRPPHLRTWRDGWRHLRFLLLYSPRWLFLYPGIALCVAGLCVSLWLLPGPRVIGQVQLDFHTLLFGAMAILIGFQSITFATFSKIFAIVEGLAPEDERLNRLFPYITLEVGLAVGALLAAVGIAFWVFGLSYWKSQHFGLLDPERTLRIVIPGFVSLVLGIQTILSSFFLSVLGMARE